MVPSTSFALLVPFFFASPAGAKTNPKDNYQKPRYVEVKSWTELQNRGKSYRAVIDKLGDESVTIKVTDYAKEKDKVQELIPIDRLRSGQLLDDLRPGQTYRWIDIKVGDEVALWVAFDDEVKQTYCLAIGVLRRPGARLPQSQRPKEDAERYNISRLLNDLENGEDVEDDDIDDFFPPHIVPVDLFRPEAGKKCLKPGGLPEKYLKMLVAIREKKAKEAKDKELKAPTPADKK